MNAFYVVALCAASFIAGALSAWLLAVKAIDGFVNQIVEDLKRRHVIQQKAREN